MRVGEAERSIAYALVLNKNFNLYDVLTVNNFLHINIILPVLLVFCFFPLHSKSTFSLFISGFLFSLMNCCF